MSDPHLTRRTVLVGSALAPLAAPSILRANTLGGGPLGQGAQPLEHGTVTVADFGDVKVHSYQSPDLTGCVTSHIVETPERLVVIDGQRSVIYGQELRDYAEGTGKPFDRMILSHLHPDHWFGAYQFRDVPLYALAETQAEIAQLGDYFIEISRPSLGAHVPPEKVVPNRTILDGTREVIDGVTFEFSHHRDAESDNLLMITLPDQRVVIAQDMLFNNCHLFCGHGNFDGWIAGLRSLQRDTSFDLILPGHGPTTGARQAIDENIAYLEHVAQAYAQADTGEALKAAILERYPNYLAAGLVDIQNLFLFPET